MHIHTFFYIFTTHTLLLPSIWVIIIQDKKQDVGDQRSKLKSQISTLLQTKLCRYECIFLQTSDLFF